MAAPLTIEQTTPPQAKAQPSCRPLKFFAGLVAGVVLALAVLMFLFYRQLGVPTESSRWAYEVNMKKQRLAEAIPGSKLLLVGGSATLFGLSARQIQNETGYPTVNLGSHASLGAAYILGLAKKVAKPGDTVVLGFEYELYDWIDTGKPKGWTDPLYLDYIFARDPEFVRAQPFPEQIRLAFLISNDRLKQGLRNKRRPPTPMDAGLYQVKNINEFGDQTGNLASNRPPTAASLEHGLCYILARGLSSQPKGFENFKPFCEWAKTNQIRVLATFPSICYRPEYEQPAAQKTVQTIRAFFKSLDVPVIGEPREAMFPFTECYDTVYHLTEEAVQERTRRFLPHLRPYLQTPRAPLTSSDALKK